MVMEGLYEVNEGEAMGLRGALSWNRELNFNQEPSFSIAFVSRLANGVAHALAKESRFYANPCFWSSPPNHIRDIRKSVRPFTLWRTLGPRPTFTMRALIVMAQKKKKIEGVSDQLNSIASQNLDHAMACRRKAPAGIRTEEWYEINSNGQEIFCKSWLPKPGVRIKGALCFCHGYGDTCTFSLKVCIAKYIASSGYGVYAIDHPGFGLSEGLHGYVPSFDGIVDNVNEQFKIMKGRPEIRGLPRFIFGQSMGGAAAIKALLKSPKERDGIMLVAPMCKISKEMSPPLQLQKILILMSEFMPKAKLVPKKDLAELAFRELEKLQMVPYNVISYSGQTRLRTVVELLNATKYIESQVKKVESPMLILHGAADKVTIVPKFSVSISV
ncbi:caffeoylshikimate esterase-like [Primulina tabacum]|uniref:caffeoylshikimate esterase-like n=1 Tax=Primulina tabacum TaxID=48773 RepID=UPI003F596F00